MIHPNYKVIKAIQYNSQTKEEADYRIKQYLNDLEVYENNEMQYNKEQRKERYCIKNEKDTATLCCLSYLDDIDKTI